VRGSVQGIQVSAAGYGVEAGLGVIDGLR